MKNHVFISFVAVGVILAIRIQTAHAATLAFDNADSYPAPPDHNYPAFNGGFGYDAWTPLADTGGGGTYMEGVGVNGRQVEGNYSFALYSGGGSFDISRQLTSPIAAGEFYIATRFDIAGAGPNVVNLRTGNNLASWSAGELLSFGIVNSNVLSYTDGSGFHVLPSGEARGSEWGWTIDFDATAGTYSGTVTNLLGGYTGNFSGSLEGSGSSVGSFGVINSSTGSNQNVIFDVPTFSVSIPEPASLSLLALGAGSLLMRRRRGEAVSNRG